MLRVGIIDSGVPEAAPDCLAEACSFDYEEGQVTRRRDGARDRLGHGSIITRIIAADHNEMALYSARVFQEKLQARPIQVAAAIDWLLECKVSIINMSFGLLEDRAVLRLACACAVGQGVILVAGAPARGKPVYPGAYPGVVRVCGDARCGPGEISFLDNTQADFGACGESDEGLSNGSSLAAARVTGTIVNILTHFPTLECEGVIDRLKHLAVYRGRERRRPP